MEIEGKQVAKKVFKRLFGYEIGDHVKFLKGRANYRKIGMILYIYPPDHKLRYLIRFPDGSNAPVKEEEIEFIEMKEYVEKANKLRKP